MAYMILNNQESIVDVNDLTEDERKQGEFFCCGRDTHNEERVCRCPLHLKQLRIAKNGKYYLAVQYGKEHIRNCEFDRSDKSCKKTGVPNYRGKNFSTDDFYDQLKNMPDQTAARPTPDFGPDTPENDDEKKEDKTPREIEVYEQNPRTLKGLVKRLLEMPLNNPYGSDEYRVNDLIICRNNTAAYRRNGIPNGHPIVALMNKVNFGKDPFIKQILRYTDMTYVNEKVIVLQDILTNAKKHVYFAVRFTKEFPIEEILTNPRQSMMENDFDIAVFSPFERLIIPSNEHIIVYVTATQVPRNLVM